MSESFDAFTTDKWFAIVVFERLFVKLTERRKLMEGWSIISRVERIWTSLIMPKFQVTTVMLMMNISVEWRSTTNISKASNV